MKCIIVSGKKAIVLSFLYLSLHGKQNIRNLLENIMYCLPVKDSKVGISEGHLFVRSGTRVEHDAVAGTVHRLQSELLLLAFESSIF